MLLEDAKCFIRLDVTKRKQYKEAEVTAEEIHTKHFYSIMRHFLSENRFFFLITSRINRIIPLNASLYSSE